MDELLVSNDDVVCGVLPVDVVVGDVKGFVSPSVDDGNGDDDRDAARSALLHAKEKASEGDDVNDVEK